MTRAGVYVDTTAPSSIAFTTRQMVHSSLNRRSSLTYHFRAESDSCIAEIDGLNYSMARRNDVFSQ